MNLNYVFWVDYDKDLYLREQPADSWKEKNRELTEKTWKAGRTEIPLQDQSFCLKVLYPGLMAGTGYHHESSLKGGDDSEISAGFSLDYVTGLPYLPGSSIKGTLRSAFLENEDYVAELLSQAARERFSAEQVRGLEQAVFGGRHPYDRRKAAAREKRDRGQDCFLDAFPVRADRANRLLGIETLASHRSEDPALQGLTKITLFRFLKVVPGVVFQFRFRLEDTELGDGSRVTAKQKLCLFKSLLLDLGTGAKTNAGYGAWEEAAEADLQRTPGKICYLE